MRRLRVGTKVIIKPGIRGAYSWAGGMEGVITGLYTNRRGGESEMYAVRFEESPDDWVLPASIVLTLDERFEDMFGEV